MVMGRNDQVLVVVRDGVSMAEIVLGRNYPNIMSMRYFEA